MEPQKNTSFKTADILNDVYEYHKLGQRIQMLQCIDDIGLYKFVNLIDEFLCGLGLSEKEAEALSFRMIRSYIQVTML